MKRNLPKKTGIIDLVKDQKNRSTLHTQYPIAIIKIR